MDLQMPEMDGHQATASLRKDERFRSLPIIAMTAHATLEERQRCLAEGMNDHVSKPIDPAVLIDTVARFCGTSGVATRLAPESALDSIGAGATVRVVLVDGATVVIAPSDAAARDERPDHSEETQS